MALQHRKRKRGQDTHTCNDKNTCTDLVRLLAWSHYLELWDQTGMACVCYVCMCVKGVSVKGCQCVEMGEVVPNESPRSEGSFIDGC